MQCTVSCLPAFQDTRVNLEYYIKSMRERHIFPVFACLSFCFHVLVLVFELAFSALA